MNYKRIMLIACVGFVFLNCSDKKDTTSMNQETVPSEQTPNGIKDLELTSDYSFKENDPFNVETVSLEGDILTINVSFSGGCEEHDFNLKFNGMYMKSLPPQASLFLEHNSNGDSCRSIVKKELKFNITSVRNGDRGVILHINEYKEKITYKY